MAALPTWYAPDRVAAPASLAAQPRHTERRACTQTQMASRKAPGRPSNLQCAAACHCSGGAGTGVARLHQEGLAGLGKVGEQVDVQRGAQVVAVGHEQVLDARPHQALQHARAQQRGVDVAVARRAPGRAPRKVGTQRFFSLVLHHRRAVTPMTALASQAVSGGAGVAGTPMHACAAPQALLLQRQTLGGLASERVSTWKPAM